MAKYTKLPDGRWMVLRGESYLSLVDALRAEGEIADIVPESVISATMLQWQEEDEGDDATDLYPVSGDRHSPTLRVTATGEPYIYRRRSTGMYYVQMTVDERKVYVGTTDRMEEAIRIRDAALKALTTRPNRRRRLSG